jgi:hypothetical protein
MNMTVATMTKQAGKGKKKAAAEAEAPAGPRTAAVIAQELQAAENKLGDSTKWESGFDALTDRVRTLERELELVRIQELPPVPATPASWLKCAVEEVEIDLIDVTGNHREDVDPQADALLVRQIQAAGGLQQPIGVRVNGDRFELIWGSRRLRTFPKAFPTAFTIAAKIYPETTTASQVEMLRSIENFGHKDLSPVERALAVARMIEQVHATVTAGGLQRRGERGRRRRGLRRADDGVPGLLG